MAGDGYHEPVGELADETRDTHRALVSLQEEIEAIDWYQQRIDASHDEALKRILAHNRDEEKEHAAMMLEWLRRRDARWDAVLRTYLFSEGDITALEDDPGPDEAGGGSAPGALTVGSLIEQSRGGQ